MVVVSTLVGVEVELQSFTFKIELFLQQLMRLVEVMVELVVKIILMMVKSDLEVILVLIMLLQIYMQDLVALHLVMVMEVQPHQVHTQQ